MSNHQLSFDFKFEKPAKRSIKIKPEIQHIIDKEEKEINECIDEIMDILYNPQRVAQYRENYKKNLSLKKDFEETMLSESETYIIDFDAMGIEENFETITADNFMDEMDDLNFE